MKIKHLYNTDKEQVALAFFHRKNATIDIKYKDKMQMRRSNLTSLRNTKDVSSCVQRTSLKRPDSWGGVPNEFETR